MAEGATYRLRLPDGREFGPARVELLRQWAQEGRVPHDAVAVPTDGGAEQPVMDIPEVARILRAPPTVAGPVPQPQGAMSGLIPYRNGPALTGYYLAVFSLLVPLLAPPAVICGVIGFRKVLREPAVRGTAHAWIAIILGTVVMAFWAIAVILISSQS